MREITNGDAMRLISEMRACYGNRFDQQWRSVEPEVLAAKFVQVLQGLSTDQIAAGFKRMLREPWPPTIPEFRLWCEQGGTWLTAEEAWVSALAYNNDPNTAITKQAHEAYIRIRQILDQEHQRAAAKAFKDVYQRIVSDCQASGEQQTNFFAVKIAPPKFEIKEAVPCPDHILEQMKTAFRSV